MPTKAPVVIPSNIQGQPEPEGPMHDSAVAIVQSFAESTEYFAKSIDTLLQESVSMRGRVQKLENNFVSIKTKEELPYSANHKFSMEEKGEKKKN